MRGFKDNLPPISYKYDYVNKIFKEFSEQYCVDLINLNYVEEANLYYRTSGKESEMCQKELFEVRKFRGEYEAWVLRPEGTASCIRMVKENSYLEGKKIARLGYYGSMFRYNRPQKGRYRQFIQAGWEWLGSNDKYTDYEIIHAASLLLNKLNINYTLEINSIGNYEDRKNYRLELKNHLKTDQDPFKILDKMENIKNIPLIKLNEEDEKVLKFILKKLKEDNINYKHNPYLVRGLDYYNGIVFEFKVDNQTVLAGGRYDGLMEQLGGNHTPAIGFAMGVDRIVDVLDYSKDISNEYAVVSIDNNEYALKVLANLRSRNKKCIPYWGIELSKALKIISKTYRYVVIIGETEAKNNSYILKDLKNSTQEILFLK